MEELPDFRALAALWLARDPRSAGLDEEAKTKIVARLARALENRRSSTDHSLQDVGLIVNIGRDSLTADQGLAEDALDQLTQFLQERIEGDGLEIEHERKDNS